MAASGCGGDSDPEAKFRAWFKNLKFRVAFKNGLGESRWYHHITGVEVVADGGWIEVTTDLDPKSDTKPDMSTLCEAAFKAADLAELGDGIREVHVKGAYGEPGGCA
jgi:hypothetical protein